MASVLTTVLYVALFIHLIMITVSLWRVWRGENVADRLIAVDMLGILTLAVLVLLALLFRNSIYIDVALALAGLGSISTIALAKYIADEQLF